MPYSLNQAHKSVFKSDVSKADMCSFILDIIKDVIIKELFINVISYF